MKYFIKKEAKQEEVAVIVAGDFQSEQPKVKPEADSEKDANKIIRKG